MRIRDPKGFSLVEMLVSIFIFTVIFSLVLAYVRGEEKSRALELSAQDLASFIRKAQFLSLTGKEKEIDGVFRFPRGGYGVRLSVCAAPPCTYYLFGDLDGQLDYDQADGEQIGAEKITLPSFVEVSGLKVNGVEVAEADVVFRPPRPTVCVDRDCSGDGNLSLKLFHTSTGREAFIFINSETGQVSVD